MKTKIEVLEQVNKDLARALANLNVIAGGGYVGSLRELKQLVKVKLKVENILAKTQAGYNWERKRYDK